MKLRIDRAPTFGGATIGLLYADDKFLSYTLEDEVRERQGVPVANWKIKGATAIPSGEYRVTLENSNRFGPDTLTINDVKGFSYIRMHAGNSQADTEGCPLLGLKVTEVSIVAGTSRPAVWLVRAAVRAALAAGELVTIDINNAMGVA